MKKILLLFLLLCGMGSAAQQSTYYYASGTIHHFKNDSTSAIFLIENINHLETIMSNLHSVFQDESDAFYCWKNNRYVVVVSPALHSFGLDFLVNTISVSSDDISFASWSKMVDKNRVWLTNEVFVLLKDPGYFESHITPVVSKHKGVSVVRENDNLIKLVCQTEDQVITLANTLYNPDIVEYSTPDFYCDIRLQTTDPYFDTQWALKNTGQNNGMIGVDIKAEEAWRFLQKTIGNMGNDIKVAVIDDGVEAHEDLYDTLGISRVLSGYTADGSNGFGCPDEILGMHGQCCAGIIGASHNTLGIAGIAPNVKIIPIRIFEDAYTPYSYSQIATGITKAWDDFGASVLNNSWCGGPENDLITYAINYVSNQGRNGKGCFVSFATGNNSHPYIDFPSTMDCVMGVGGIRRNGLRASYSNYGTGLDVVAPCDTIVTTDRVGDLGFDIGNYFEAFQGTSASCPHVAGIAALMLSVNPELTRTQMMDIIKRNCQKVGGYNYQTQNNDPELTWNTEAGHGLVDAHKSVVKSALFGHDIHIIGSTQINDFCVNDFFLDIPYPEAFTFTWSCSSNLIVNNTECNHLYVYPISNGNAWISVSYYSENRLIDSCSKNIVISLLENNSVVVDSLLNLVNDAVWANNYYLHDDLVIDSGVILRVTGNLYCSSQTVIIIKPGGKLILDGATVTNICGGMWRGIEVWGDSNAHQQEVNGSYLQGYVELRNGAVIENARCALRLRNPLVGGASGGIVHATGAVFLNNALAVEASSFTNHGVLSQRELDYNGWFRDCSFTIDDDFFGQSAFHSHASLANVSGIAFEGCGFSADRTVDSVDFLCSGISAYNAGFTVRDYCDSNTLPCPSNSLVHSSFSGFHRGVSSVNDGQVTKSFIVRDGEFTGNDIGVFALNTATATTVGNTFTVGGLMDCSFGVYLESVSICRVEENVFAGAAGTQSVTYGVAVKDCPAANDIYLNQFTGLDYGNLAIGINNNNSQNGSQPPVTTGLTYTCNDNTSNTVDFRIDDGGNYTGIQPVQGSSAVGAGNTFSGSAWHIHNDGDTPLTYYYYGAGTGQTPSSAKLYRVSVSSSMSGNSCPCHYGNSPIKQSQSALDSLASAWEDAVEVYGSLRDLYDALYPDSETADTQAAAALQAAMNDQAHEATTAAGDIIRSLVNSPGSDNSELRRWLLALGCPEADRVAVASLLEEGDTEGALSAAQSLTGKYSPKRLDPVEQEEYTGLVKLYTDLIRTGRSIFELTDGEKALVEKTAEEGTGQAGAMARALLEGIGGGRDLTICPADIMEEFRGDGRSSQNQTVEMDDNPDFAVTVVPTPATTWISIDYKLPEDCAAAVFELSNMTCVKVLETVLDGHEGRKTIDLRKLPVGVYFYSARCGHDTRSGKVVIAR